MEKHDFIILHPKVSAKLRASTSMCIKAETHLRIVACRDAYCRIGEFARQRVCRSLIWHYF